jgi:hypothetical protein
VPEFTRVLARAEREIDRKTNEGKKAAGKQDSDDEDESGKKGKTKKDKK